MTKIYNTLNISEDSLNNLFNYHIERQYGDLVKKSYDLWNID